MSLHGRLLQWYLARSRRVIVSENAHKRLRSAAGFAERRRRWLIGLLARVQPAHAVRALELLPQLNGQFHQDLVAALLRPAEIGPGYYVEFGATNGSTISNTLLLEQLGWQGILAEPARHWHEALHANRKAYISTECLWRESGLELEFHETREAEVSRLDVVQSLNVDRPSVRESYRVRTISLEDLLLQAGAPRTIDFLSIDTEGSELAILTPFPFADWQIRFIAVEHNDRPDREAMVQLLTGHGYRRILTEVSYVDDWYVHPEAYARAAEVFRLDGRD